LFTRKRYQLRMIRGERLKHARRMRAEPTNTEQALWKLVRGRRFEGLKFRRQVPMGRYVADLVCEAHRLIIEADGPFHDPVHDQIRDQWFQSKGYETIRFPIDLVQSRPDLVLQDIAAAVARRPQQPHFRTCRSSEI
jgi:very-short-patch-repair endonuclease